MKKYLISTLIIISRCLDLYSTQFGIINFKEEEQNLLVSFFNLNMTSFFILELILAILMVICYLYFSKNKNVFIIQEISFFNYLKMFFYDRVNPNILDWIFKMKTKKILILFGSIIPIFVITISIIFSLNNYWVYQYNSGNNIAINYYEVLNKFYFFDFLIFIFPPLFISYLIYKKLRKSYDFYN
jgi:hypothetical protein